MCISPENCEHVALSNAFGEDLRKQLGAERAKTSQQKIFIELLKNAVESCADILEKHAGFKEAADEFRSHIAKSSEIFKGVA